MPYIASFGPDGQVPLMGGGGDSGDILYAGLIGPNPASYDTGYIGGASGSLTSRESTSASSTTSTSSALPSPTGFNVFYIFNRGGTGPNPMGSNTVNLIGSGIAPALDWSCETI